MEKVYVPRKVSKKKKKEEIMKYWNERAVLSNRDPSATTNDIHLRELEIKTILEKLKGLKRTKNISILDIGCADGISTMKIAESLPGVKFLGIDYSSKMIKNANSMLKSKNNLSKRGQFLVGDVSNLDKICGKKLFDIIISDRLLINLDSAKTQHKVISEVHKHLKLNGYYIAIENFIEGQKKLNDARKEVGLSEIILRWHNLFLKKKNFTNYSQKIFKIVEWDNFASAYYYVTRVVYSKMCKIHNRQPNYNHEIHKLSIDLPPFGEFSPVQMVIMKKIKK